MRRATGSWRSLSCKATALTLLFFRIIFFVCFTDFFSSISLYSIDCPVTRHAGLSKALMTEVRDRGRTEKTITRTREWMRSTATSCSSSITLNR